MVELRIPFKTLRFRDTALQDWGLNIYRKIQRNGYSQAWAPVTRNETNQLAQAGRLAGLRDLDAGLFLEVNPVVTGTRLGTYDDAAAGLEHQTERPEFGLNMTYGLTSNLTLDGTYNPDFSQVEADAGQIAVNERFALFFPEKRPFFLEGTEIFKLQKQLVYTRSVVDPVAGTKITGKVGSFNVGYMGAVDRVSSDLSDNDAVVNLFRLRRDLGRSSTVGMVYTDRTRTGDIYNRVAGADARFVFARRYTVDVLGAESFTGVGAGSSSAGSIFSAKLARTGREFSFSSEIEDVDPDFNAGSGFIRRIGDTQAKSQISFNRYGKPGSLIERYGPSLEVEGTWDHDAFWAGGGSLERKVELRSSLSFRNNITLWMTGSRTGFTFPASDYDGLVVETGDASFEDFAPDQSLFEGLYSLGGFVMLNPWEKVRGVVRFGWSETPLFDRSSAVPVEPADQWGGNVEFNLYPTTSLSGQVGVRNTTLYRKRDGSRYSSATIPRIRAQYQLTKALFVRGIFEYAMIERQPLLDPASGMPIQRCDGTDCSQLTGTDGYDIHVEALVSYEPSPGTVMYIGYSREMEDTGSFRFRQVRPQADGLFAKLSYGFRY